MRLDRAVRITVRYLRRGCAECVRTMTVGEYEDLTGMALYAKEVPDA